MRSDNGATTTTRSCNGLHMCPERVKKHYLLKVQCTFTTLQVVTVVAYIGIPLVHELYLSFG